MNAYGWTIATVAVTGGLWMPYVLDRFFTVGLRRSLGDFRPADEETQSSWARRAKRAHSNAVEGLVVFAPLAALAIHRGLANDAVVTGACITYFFARAVHYVAYAAGVPVVRTVAFLGGFAGQAILAVVLLGGAS